MVERLQRVGPPEVVRPIRRRVHARLFVDAQDDVLPDRLRAAPVRVLLDVGPVARERPQQTPDAVARRDGPDVGPGGRRPPRRRRRDG
jgi:hypothetical protein